jgi:Ca-activated chloride channel homolog
VLVLPLLIVLVTACANEPIKEETEPAANTETENSEGKESESIGSEDSDLTEEKRYKELEDAIAIPTTFTELINYPVGKYSGKQAVEQKEELAEEVKKSLPKLEDDVSEEILDQYFSKVMSITKEEYVGPENVLKEIRLASFGDPTLEDSRYQFKDNFNVEIILDASGSMAGQVEGKSKMDLAKEAIQSFISSLPENANVGLRVYGHKGTNNESDKELSCSSTELLYNIQPYNEANLKSALDQVKPAGWTPITLSLNEAMKDMEQYPSETNTNMIYLVSDGIATCGGDPVTAAKSLADSNVKPILNVIGFDVDAEGQNQLKSVAEAADGMYKQIQNQQELKDELNKASEMAQKWSEWKEKADEGADRQHTKNDLDIFGYTVKQEGNALRERSNIRNMLQVLKDDGYINDEQYRYLDDKKTEYSNWIMSEIERFDKELEAMNDKNYAQIKQELEQKYNENTN